MEPRIPGHPLPLIVAEIGTSHGGDLSKAEELVAAAKESGAQVAKFQYVIADEILHPRTGSVSLPGGNTDLYKAFKNLEKPIDFYARLMELCEQYQIGFLCSPFGTRSLQHLVSLGVPALKIASPELNHLPLLREAAATGLPTILSTGVSRLRDIADALEVFAVSPRAYSSGNRLPKKGEGIDTLAKDDESAHPAPDDANIGKIEKPFVNPFNPALNHRVSLLHCITSYPAPEAEYNLRVIRTLHGIFGIPLGVSDHSLDPVLVPLLATALGAHLIEKHLTLDKTSSGLDDPIALVPQQFAHMASLIASYKDDPFAIIPDLEEEYGSERVQQILGSGVKELAKSESDNYGRTNRSIHALHSLPAGSRLGVEDVAVLRTEKSLSPGIHPRFMDIVLGKRLTMDLEDGEGLTWNHLLQE